MHYEAVRVDLLYVLAFLQGHLAKSLCLWMAGVNEVAGILKREYPLVFLGTLGCLATVGSQDLANINVFVLEEAICGFGLCPICACLVNGAFRSVREPVAQLDQSCIESFVTETDFREFLLRPTGVVFVVHCVPPHLLLTC